MAFKASPAKKGLFNIHGIEEFVERFIERKLKEARVEERILELRKALHLEKKTAKPVAKAEVVSTPVPVVESAPAVPEPRRTPKAEAPVKPAKAAPKAKSAPKAKPAKAPKASKPAAKAGDVDAADVLAQLQAALDGHAKKAALVKAGAKKDQLLRSLIPLYLGQKLAVEVSSGTTSKFWAAHGITYAAPNAAKALREHKGYAKRTAKGVQITAAGVKYVDEALKA